MKTGRGPLSTEWREEYAREINRNSSYVGSNESKKEIMCAYKLCKVEFKYWGMQTKTEKFIHDIGGWIEMGVFKYLFQFIFRYISGIFQ